MSSKIATEATEKRLARLCHALEAAVDRALSPQGRECGVAFSGGLDSSLLALLAARSRADAGRPLPTLYAAGLKGSHDLAAAASAVELLEESLGRKLKLVRVQVSPREAREGLEALLQLIGPDPLTLGFLLPLHITAKAAAAAEPLLVSGQGADELFGGYARYRSMGKARLAEALAADTRALLEGGLERDMAVAAAAGKELACPYLDPEVVAAAQAFPAAHRRGPAEGPGKELLREAALELGLPAQLARRPKKAAQYGSGFQRTVQAHFKPLHTATLELELDSPATARAVAEATGLDNLPYVALNRAGAKLTVKAAAASLGSLEQTLDDFLACADAAVKVAELAVSSETEGDSKKSPKGQRAASTEEPR